MSNFALSDCGTKLDMAPATNAAGKERQAILTPKIALQAVAICELGYTETILNVTPHRRAHHDGVPRPPAHGFPPGDAWLSEVLRAQARRHLRGACEKVCQDEFGLEQGWRLRPR